MTDKCPICRNEYQTYYDGREYGRCIYCGYKKDEQEEQEEEEYEHLLDLEKGDLVVFFVGYAQLKRLSVDEDISLYVMKRGGDSHDPKDTD